jgi:hypothetical protein
MLSCPKPCLPTNTWSLPWFKRFFSFFNCCAGWGCIVAFPKVLTIHQIYQSWIHLLHHSPLSSSPIPVTVSTGIIFLFTYTCTPYLYQIHSSTRFPDLLPPATATNPPKKDMSHPLVFRYWKWCLKYLHREFPWDISVYVCTITEVGSPLLILFLNNKNAVLWYFRLLTWHWACCKMVTPAHVILSSYFFSTSVTLQTSV